MPNKVNYKTLVVIERDSFVKDTELLKIFETSLGSQFNPIVYAYTPSAYVSRFLDTYALCIKNGFLRKVIKAMVLMCFPKFWSYYIPGNDLSFEEKIERVTRVIRKQKGEVYLLGRSSGARIATLCAKEKNVAKIICIGYPFKHPKKVTSLSGICIFNTLKSLP